MSRSDSRRGRPDSTTTPPHLPPVIPVHGSFEGLLSFRGNARIDGELRGEVLARGTLHLGETARVQARIEVDELIVAGALEGDVVATRRIQLLPSARVQGELSAPRVSMADGCVLRGRCRAGVRTQSPPEAATSSSSLP